jgi:hypothetical protein
MDSKLNLRNPAIGSARRKMEAGVLAVRQSHFSSATQETWGYPPPQSRVSRDKKCGLVTFTGEASSLSSIFQIIFLLRRSRKKWRCYFLAK